MKKRILSMLLVATMLLSLVPMTVFADLTPEYKYTEYENWQIKYGNTWEWSGNMEKVEDGLFKLEIWWQGTGINVQSDEKPIKKDWFAPEELILGEEVIAPVNVDVYLKVVDDETVKIGLGVIPEDNAPASYTYSVKFPKGPEQVYIIGDTSNWATFTPMTMTSDTTATITVDTQFTAYKYTAGANWDYVEKDAQGNEISNRTAYADPDVVGSWAAVPASHTHNLVKVNGQAATETASGWRDYYECKDSTDACHKYFEDSNGLTPIENLDTWKAQGGAGYIPKLGDKKIITEISLSLTEYTRNNISFTSISYPEAKITGITEGNENVKLETGYIYFFDKDGKWIYACWVSGPEAKPVWYDMSSYKVDKDGLIEGEKVIDTAPDYSKIKKAIASVFATSENGFAPELKATVNGKALGVSKMDKGTYNADDMAGYQVMEQYCYFFVPFDIADSTTAPQTDPKSPQNGDTSNMALWLILMALSSMGLCACLVLGKKVSSIKF